jgi:hypothetical protein
MYIYTYIYVYMKDINKLNCICEESKNRLQRETVDDFPFRIRFALKFDEI